MNEPALDRPGLISQPRLRQLYDYWRGLRPHGMPARRDIDPAAFRFVLGHVFLVDVRRDPPCFRYRLFGVNLSRNAGYDLTGKTVEDIPTKDMRDYLRRHYLTMLAKPGPIADRGERNLMGTRGFELLLLPLADDGRTLDMILGALLYGDPLSPER